MIYVAKPPRKAPKEFLDIARMEQMDVIRRAESRRPAYPFKAYRHQSLKDALEVIFGKKCAYCESSYEIAGYLEVEHYRPKALYYWLASEWSNLLPACKRCNNGKLAKFPLTGKQGRRKGCEKYESPLLLNPSDPTPARRPEKHLTFDAFDGSIRVKLVSGQPSQLGISSIDVYRLTRIALSRARKSWALRVWNQMFLNDPIRRQTLSNAQRKLVELADEDLRDVQQPYRALTRCIIRESRRSSTSRRNVVPKDSQNISSRRIRT